MAIGFVLGSTPGFPAPQWVEDACWQYAYRVRPALNWREMEAYWTSCVAAGPAGKRT
jgi:hypothetical protein